MHEVVGSPSAQLRGVVSKHCLGGGRAVQNPPARIKDSKDVTRVLGENPIPLLRRGRRPLPHICPLSPYLGSVSPQLPVSVRKTYHRPQVRASRHHPIIQAS